MGQFIIINNLDACMELLQYTKTSIKEMTKLVYPNRNTNCLIGKENGMIIKHISYILILK